MKTKINSRDSFRSVLTKLSQETHKIRESNADCWSGLFIYESSLQNVDGVILALLQEITANNQLSAINYVCVGRHAFIRFWDNGQPDSGLESRPIWHSYELNNLAQAYFVSNLVSHLSTNFSEHTSDAWFPIQGLKEIHRLMYVYLTEGDVESFA